MSARPRTKQRLRLRRVAQGPAVPPMSRTELPGGTVLVCEQIRDAQSVALGAYLRLGSRHEHDDEQGYFHFLEHALFKGTRHYSGAGLARAIDAVGGQLDAFTGRDATAFYVRVLPDHIDVALELLAELLLRPQLASRSIETERGVILEELKMVEDNPDEHIHDLFMQQYYPQHPLGRPIAGTRSSIVALKRARLLKFFRSRIAAPQMVFAAAGRFDPRRLQAAIQERFSALPIAADPGPPQPKPQPAGGVRVHHKEGLEQAHLCIGAPMPSLRSPQRYAAHLLNIVLGGSMSSRLFQNVRERLGLAYAIDSAVDLFSDSGCLTVYAGCSTAEVGRVVELVLRELHALRHRGVRSEELRRAQEHLKGSLALAQESTGSRMSNLARNEIAFRRLSTLQDAFRAIDRTDRQQLLELAQQYLSPERLALTLLCNGGRKKIPLPDFQLAS